MAHRRLIFPEPENMDIIHIKATRFIEISPHFPEARSPHS
jgi:hypothetical protein